jgi:hypothetical protein
MRTKIRLFLGLGVAFVVFAVAVNAGAFRGGGGDDEPRNCGAGVRPRSVVAIAIWSAKVGQQRSYVSIHGAIGPANISEPHTSISPARFPAKACPGETASITVVAVSGPLPNVRCDISVGGSNLTGDAIQRVSTPGYRANCQAAIV